MFFRDKLLSRPGTGVSGSVEIWGKFNGEKYAVKIYHEKEPYELKKEYQERVLHEFRLLRELDHEAFFAPLKYTVSWNGSTVRMYMDAGLDDLAKLFKKQKAQDFSIPENLCLWKQLASGVSYLHAKGISHRDKKLENVVLLDSGKLKIIDMATATSKNPAVGIVGSPKYMAPEMVSLIEYDGRMADMWSLGVVLVYFVTKKFLWKSAHLSDPDYEKWVRDGEAVDLQAIPEALRRVMVKLLCVDTDQRCTMEALHEETIFLIKQCLGLRECGAKHTLLKYST